MGGKNNTIQASDSINDAGTCRQVNIKIVRNALLIWLDNNIDDNNEACRNTVAQLRRTFNIVNTFTNPDQCIDYLSDICDEKASIIISGALCEDIVPFIHDITQLDDIFIFCENQTRYEQLVKDWPKIKRVSTRISQICEDFKEASQEDDKDVHKLTDHIREKTFPHAKGWYHLHMVLYKMSQFQKSQQVYQILIDQLTNESEKASIYNQLRLVKNDQRDYPETIIFHEKSLEIYKKTLPPNHLNLTTSYNNIDLISDNMGEYSKALSSHNKALEIQQQSLPSNHSSLTIQLQVF